MSRPSAMLTSTSPYVPLAIRAITAPLVTRAAPSISYAEALVSLVLCHCLTHTIFALDTSTPLFVPVDAVPHAALPRRHTNGAHHATFSPFRLGCCCFLETCRLWCGVVVGPSRRSGAMRGLSAMRRQPGFAVSRYDTGSWLLPLLLVHGATQRSFAAGLGQQVATGVSWCGALVSLLHHIGVDGARSCNVWRGVLVSEWPRHLAVVVGVYRVANGTSSQD
ncbi:hypothetical protein C8J57DRAFT_1235850 [Mycena rebaudengoi]|nr:hypothetical protein C8J57DRAFT_1235850 [Mycena rebaudengoi]